MDKTALGVPESIKQYMDEVYGGKKPATLPTTPAKSPSVKEIDAMLKNASEKKWTSIKIKGTDEFKEAVWMQSQKYGIAVDGYTPSKEAMKRYLEAQKRHQKGAGLLARFFNKTDAKNNKNPGTLNVHNGYNGPKSKNGKIDDAEFLETRKPSMAVRAILRLNRVLNHPLVQVPLLIGAYCTGPGGCMAYGAVMALKDATIGVIANHERRKDQLEKVKQFTALGLHKEAAAVQGTSRWNYVTPFLKMGSAVALSYAGGFVLGATFGSGAQPHTLGNNLGMAVTKMAVAGALFTASLAVRGKDVRDKRHMLATVAAVGLGTIASCYVGGSQQDYLWGDKGSSFFGGRTDTSLAARLASWKAHVR